MKFIVTLDYKKFLFDCMHDAAIFACEAKSKAMSDMEVEIKVEDDPEDQETEN